MITFLIVTSIINLALGYALAVYLRHSSNARTPLESVSRSAATTFDSIEVFPMPPSDSSWSLDGLRATTSAGAGQPSSELARNSTHATMAADGSLAGDAFQDRASETEDELLAGIEDFRHQLSKLKGQGIGAGILDPLTVGAGG